MKKLVIAATLFGTAAVVAHLHASMQIYYPVMKIATPGEVTYTVVLAATHDRPACRSAARRFIEPVPARCPDCAVVSARCETELHDIELALHSEQPLPMYVVSMPGVRVAIAAEELRAQVACNAIADDAVRRGAPNAACLLPTGH